MKKRLFNAYQIVFIVLFVALALTIVFYKDISALFSVNRQTPLASSQNAAPGALSGGDESYLEAMFYKTLQDMKVQCQMCFRNCTIGEGDRGFCLSRENIGGKLYTLTYGKPAAVHIDPVEKIPFSHFFPGTDALALGTAACNFRCLNCINWQFAWKAPEEVEELHMTPGEVVKTAEKNNLKTICFTYNEPTNCYEYMLEVFKLAKGEGLHTVFHTNGSMNPEPFDALCPYVDAVVVDLKGFTDDFYEDTCSAKLQPVKDFLVSVKKQDIWLEVVNLVIPGKNDDPGMIREMCRWFVENLGPDVPLQFSRFFPTNQLSNLPPTPVTALEAACTIAEQAGIHYVYIGNVPGSQKINTYCPKCDHLVIERVGLSIRTFEIEGGKCKRCGYPIAGAWKFEGDSK